MRLRMDTATTSTAGSFKLPVKTKLTQADPATPFKEHTPSRSKRRMRQDASVVLSATAKGVGSTLPMPSPRDSRLAGHAEPGFPGCERSTAQQPSPEPLGHGNKHQKGIPGRGEPRAKAQERAQADPQPRGRAQRPRRARRAEHAAPGMGEESHTRRQPRVPTLQRGPPCSPLSTTQHGRAEKTVQKDQWEWSSEHSWVQEQRLFPLARAETPRRYMALSTTPRGHLHRRLSPKLPHTQQVSRQDPRGQNVSNNRTTLNIEAQNAHGGPKASGTQQGKRHSAHSKANAIRHARQPGRTVHDEDTQCLPKSTPKGPSVRRSRRGH